MTITSVANPASGQATAAPGALLSIFGTVSRRPRR